MMRIRRIPGTLFAVVVVVLAIAVVPAATASAKGHAATRSPAARTVTVGRDPSGDWGANDAPMLAPGGDPIGADLTGAAIAMDGPDTLTFVLRFTALPDTAPETTDYEWDFASGGDVYELFNSAPEVGSFTFHLARCNPSINSSIDLGGCPEVATTQAKIVDGKALLVPIAATDIKATPGATISPSPSFVASGASVVAYPDSGGPTYVNSTGTPDDEMMLTRSFVVPRMP